MNYPIPVGNIEQRIYPLRGQRIMLDVDLAAIYRVPTKRLNEQVRRNQARFPEDFMFQLTASEAAAMRSQIATASRRNVTARPYAFTEHGVVMLASVLKSPTAVQASILIVRAFNRFRWLLASREEVGERLRELERRLDGHDVEIKTMFEEIRQLISPPEKPARRIGFMPRGLDQFIAECDPFAKTYL